MSSILEQIGEFLFQNTSAVFTVAFIFLALCMIALTVINKSLEDDVQELGERVGRLEKAAKAEVNEGEREE